MILRGFFVNDFEELFVFMVDFCVNPRLILCRKGGKEEVQLEKVSAHSLKVVTLFFSVLF